MNPWRGLKNISHNVWILAFATLINRAGMMVIPFLTLYMTKEMHFSAGKAGLVLFFYGLGALLTAPLVGRLADRLGSLLVMKLSLITTGLMLFVYPFITDFNLILIYTFVWSVIGEAFRPANLSLISQESEPAQRKTAFALNRLAINLGMSIGPVVGGFLTTIDFSLLFYVDGATSILAGLFLVVVPFEHKTIKNQAATYPEETAGRSSLMEDENRKSAPIKKESVIKDKRLVFFLLSLIPVNLVFFQHIGAMPIYIVRDLGFNEATYGLLSAVNTVLIILIEVPLNNMISGWSDRNALIVGAVLCGIGFGAMAFAAEIVFLILTIVVWTFGEMIFFPASTSYTSAISPDERRGEYMGYFQMTFSLALMAGPWLGTVVLDNYGAFILWGATFVLSLASAVFFLLFTNKSTVLIEAETKK